MAIFSSEKLSSDYLCVNNCGCQVLHERDTGSFRPNGRIDYHLLYIYEGCCYVTLNGKTIAAPAGSVVVFLPFQPQDYKFYKKDKSISYFLHFSGTACQQLMIDLELHDKNICYIGKSLSLQKLLHTLIDEFHQKEKYNRYRLQGLLLELISLIARKNSIMLYSDPSTHKKFSEVCRKMRERFASNDTIADYAKLCNLSESRFSHQFSEIMGVSPKQYLITVRIEAAKELLTTSDLTILQISEAVGLFNQNYFSRIFKKYTGLSPSEYRKLY